MYQIEDLQIAGRLFADGAEFKTLDEVRDQLIDYHLIDCEEDDEEVLKSMTLAEICELNGWAVITK
jgi:hypothetical protein